MNRTKNDIIDMMLETMKDTTYMVVGFIMGASPVLIILL